jgi:putative membrane protein
VLFAVALGAGGLVAWRRARGRGEPVTGRQLAAWLSGSAAAWVASDWPLGALGAGYLLSAHMAMTVIYTMVAAPLLLVGMPASTAQRLLGGPRRRRVARALTRPLVAGVLFNVVLVALLLPPTVEALRGNTFGSFALDMTALGAGVVLWAPICAPLPELRARNKGVKVLYLFLAGAVIEPLPSGILGFAAFPLYSTYELAPRIGGFTAIADQQLGGVVMGFGASPVVWSVLFVLLYRWYCEDVAPDRPGFGPRGRPVAAPAAGAGAVPGDGRAIGLTDR